MIQFASAFRSIELERSFPSSKPGAVTTTAATLKAEDNIDLRSAGLTVEQQTHQPAPKLIHLTQKLEHEHPDLSVKNNLHLNLSLYG